jgi:predicted transcriptional regulator
MEKTTLYLDPETHRQLQEAARRQQRPQAQLIREAVAAYLATQSRPLPRSIGMGEDGTLAGSEVKDWLRANWRPR